MYTQNEIDGLIREDYTEKMFKYLIDLGVATEEEVSLTTSVAGWNPETMNSILYYKTGYNDLGQLLEQNGLLIN